MMDVLMISFVTISSAFVIFASCFMAWGATRRTWTASMKRKSTTTSFPEIPGAWPLAGHLPLLLRKRNLPRTLAALGNQCDAPTFTIKIGLRRWLIVNDWKIAKECFTTNDKVFASRPSSTTARYVGHNQAIFAFSPYGSYWRDARKFMVNELLSNSKVQSLKQLRLNEIDEFVKDIYSFINGNERGEAIPITIWLNRLMINLITMMTARKRYGYLLGTKDDVDVILTAMEELMNGAGLLALPDAFPFAVMEWLDPQGNIGMLKKISSQLDLIIGTWITEHQQNGAGYRHHQDRDFIDLLLSAMAEGKLKSNQHTSDIVVQAMIEALIIGGSNTTSTTMVWLLSLLLNNQRAMKCVVEEIDQVVGKHRKVEDRDLNSLTYLEAVVKETLRLYPPIPLLVPHLSTTNCTVGGYYVPQGTRMLVNIWKIHRDPQTWTDPNEFRPERFLMSKKTIDYESREQSFSFLPFGFGRRSCPGAKLALEMLHLTAARLLQGFVISTPSNNPVDVAEGSGNNISKAVPLQLVFTPRLPRELYLC